MAFVNSPSPISQISTIYKKPSSIIRSVRLVNSQPTIIAISSLTQPIIIAKSSPIPLLRLSPSANSAQRSYFVLDPLKRKKRILSSAVSEYPDSEVSASAADKDGGVNKQRSTIRVVDNERKIRDITMLPVMVTIVGCIQDLQQSGLTIVGCIQNLQQSGFVGCIRNLQQFGLWQQPGLCSVVTGSVLILWIVWEICQILRKRGWTTQARDEASIFLLFGVCGLLFGISWWYR